MTGKTTVEANIISAPPKINVNIQTSSSMKAADKSFVFEQATASVVWAINHGLNKFCSVTVVDSSGNEVIGETRYIDKNNIEIRFSSAFSGRAYLN